MNSNYYTVRDFHIEFKESVMLILQKNKEIKISFLFLLMLSTKLSLAQTPQYFEFQEYHDSNLEVFTSSAESACSQAFSNAQAAALPQLSLFGRTLTKIEERITLWFCGWNIVNENAPGFVFDSGTNIDATCQTREAALGPRPVPFHPIQTPRISIDGSGGDCHCANGLVFDSAIQWCVEAPTNKENGCEGNAPNYGPNPCNIATGNKLRIETDIENGALSFTRYYNSLGVNFNTGLGLQWTHNYQKSLIIQSSTIMLVSPSGRSESFVRESGQLNRWRPDADSDYQMSFNNGVYTVVLPSGAEERYGSSNKILSHIDTNGNQTTYEYEQIGVGQFDHFEYLISVTNHYGQSIRFEYESVPGFVSFEHLRINKITDAFGAVYQYQYDENRNLTTVIYPDTTPSDDTDNPRKIYHYENQDYPNHLTGITDENGERYGNFAYDDDGKAILSELGVTTNVVGQEKIELDFQ